MNTPTMPEAELFRPHFTDRIIAWIESLPFSNWGFYVLFFIAVGLAFTLLSWVLRINQPGRFFASYFLLGTWFVENLFINHFLVRIARGALDEFKPMIPTENARYQQTRYEITHIPGGAANIWFFAGALVGLGVVSYASDHLDMALLLPRLFLQLTAGVGFALFLTAAFRAIHQLKIVRRLLREIPKFSLYDLSSIYALSLFPAKMILMNVVYLWVNPAVLIFPGLFSDLNLLGFWVFFSLLPAFAIYPSFHGIRRRLIREKDAMLKENSQHLEAASREIYLRMGSGQHSGMAELEKGVSALLAFRREIESVSTYPWKPDTMRWLSTAMVLPLVLWIIQFVVQRVFIR